MLNDEPQVGAVHAAVAARLAPEDARRSEYLDWIVKKGGTCRGCGATVSDAGLVEHPGVCGSCHHRKHLAPLEPPAPAKAPEPREDTIVAKTEERLCKNCKKNRLRADNASGICRTCRVAPARGRVSRESVETASRSAARTVRARNGFRGQNLAGMSVEDLVGTIAGCREELGRRKEELAGQQAAIEQALGSG